MFPILHLVALVVKLGGGVGSKHPCGLPRKVQHSFLPIQYLVAFPVRHRDCGGEAPSPLPGTTAGKSLSPRGWKGGKGKAGRVPERREGALKALR